MSSTQLVPDVTVATLVAPLGVNPDVVERWTSYLVTPTLSVDAVQLSVTLPIAPVAVTPVGAVGAMVSTEFDSGSIGAMDGTPWSLIRKR